MSEPLTFVSWKWAPMPGYRSKFGPEAVLALRTMIERHYHLPFRFVCVTDDASGLDGVETIPLWTDHKTMLSAHGAHNPSCYRRLKLFASDAGAVFGPRVVSIDLDMVIVDDITPLFAVDVDFKGWGCSDYPKQWLNGSLWLLKTGTHPEVWDSFDPATSPKKARKAGCFGSDQAWMRYVLGPKVPTWGESDGVYSYRKHIVPRGNVLPSNAKVVAFHGKIDPWHDVARQHEWVRKNYPSP